MNKKIIAVILGVVVIGGGAFYGGLVYGQSHGRGNVKGDFASMTPTERQARAQQFGTNSQRGARMGGGFNAGEILSKDDKSVIIKLPTGGSKIVLFSTATQVMKSTTGSINDLVVGENITASGSDNSDGSVTAESIQIRPAGSVPTALAQPVQ